MIPIPVRLLVGLVFATAPAIALADGPGCLAQIKKAVEAAKISLKQAVEAGQKEVPDGKVVDAELKWTRSPAFFEVELLINNALKEVRIDAVSGKRLAVENQKPDAAAVTALSEVQQALAGAKLSAVQALDAAKEAVKGGQPLAIALGHEQGRLVYAVKALEGDKLRDVTIDVVAGGILDIADERLPLALWTFDAAESGTTPADLRAKQTHPGGEPGQWKVAADGTAPSKPSVLRLTTEAPKATFNVAEFDQTAYKDLDLRVRLKANQGQEDQGGGLIWRCRDENNYYICRFNPLESNFRVYKVVDGKRSQLESVDLKTEPGRWYAVRAVMVGDQIICYLDGRKHLEVKDDTFKEAGMIGLWTKADASSSFDDLAVYAPAADQPTSQAKGQGGPRPGAPGEPDDDD